MLWCHLGYSSRARRTLSRVVQSKPSQYTEEKLCVQCSPLQGNACVLYGPSIKPHSSIRKEPREPQSVSSHEFSSRRWRQTTQSSPREVP